MCGRRALGRRKSGASALAGCLVIEFGWLAASDLDVSVLRCPAKNPPPTLRACAPGFLEARIREVVSSQPPSPSQIGDVPKSVYGPSSAPSDSASTHPTTLTLSGASVAFSDPVASLDRVGCRSMPWPCLHRKNGRAPAVIGTLRLAAGPAHEHSYTARSRNSSAACHLSTRLARPTVRQPPGASEGRHNQL